MRVLVACEFSGVVRRAFASRGHFAVSVDLLESDDKAPWGVNDYSKGWHYQGDILDFIKQGETGEMPGDWDLMIAFPPCTHLAVSGSRLFSRKAVDQALALAFVKVLLDAPIKRIALENPVGVISTRIRKPDQIIQPHEFGHDASKKTCLWLKNLPLLKPTRRIIPLFGCSCGTRFPLHMTRDGCPNCHGAGKVRYIWGNQTPTGQNRLGPSKDRWKLRSMTYQGVADAMAEQWGKS